MTARRSPLWSLLLQLTLLLLVALVVLIPPVSYTHLTLPTSNSV